MQANIGLIGLAVMGQNLVLNFCDNGYKVAVFNRTASVTESFAASDAASGRVVPCYDIETLVAALERPRAVMIMVRAGDAVDAVIESLLAHLDKDDIIVDLGNTRYTDTQRRAEHVASKGLRYVGCGVSGGELGARHGPSIMPGGEEQAWPHLEQMLQSVAAKVENEPCCAWLGRGGAGHYVKMVHNGIEYGDMQLIAEAYQFMQLGLGMNHDEMAACFDTWNTGDLDSYLIEITAEILAFKDEDGEPLVTRILDSAGQKGTGKWTGIDALQLGVPVSIIGEAVFSRCLSSLKDERVKASSVLSGPDGAVDMSLWADRDAALADLEAALYAAKIASYAQGFMLLKEASNEHDWDLNFGAIAMLWRGGCIIRSRFLRYIRDAYRDEPSLDNLMLAPFFQQALGNGEAAWRRIVAAASLAGIPVPALATGLSFYDGYRRGTLPANLLQAQRDYFGAHTYERTDKPRGEYFHTNWTGEGGDVSASTYNT